MPVVGTEVEGPWTAPPLLATGKGLDLVQPSTVEDRLPNGVVRKAHQPLHVPALLEEPDALCGGQRSVASLPLSEDLRLSHHEEYRERRPVRRSSRAQQSCRSRAPTPVPTEPRRDRESRFSCGVAARPPREAEVFPSAERCRRRATLITVSPTVFDEYGGYMHQRVAVLGATGARGPETDVDSAIGFVVEEGGSDPDLLRTTVLDVVRPADLTVEDRRSEYDWGASGPLVHELVITVAIGVPASIVSAALYDCLRAALRRARRSEDAPGANVREDTAWETFASFVEFAMGARRVRLEEVNQRHGHWYARAWTDRGVVEGIIDGDGLLAARVVREGQPALAWPPG